MQLAEKVRVARAVLADAVAVSRSRCGDEPASSLADVVWEPPVASPVRGFRNKAKLVVSGRRGAVILGLGVPTQTGRRFGKGKRPGTVSDGVDLCDCPLYSPQLARALPALRDFLNRTGIRPYNVATDNGELKYLLVSAGTTGEIMARVVLRTPRALGRLRSELAQLQQELPQLRVLSANIQPLHAAIIEGDTEYLLTETSSIAAPLGSLQLREIPGAFFQTNDEVATVLYATAREWVNELLSTPTTHSDATCQPHAICQPDTSISSETAHPGRATQGAGTKRASSFATNCAPLRIWDLYCGVGGFSLALAGSGRAVTGVEVNESAVYAARAAAQLSCLRLSGADQANPNSVANRAAGGEGNAHPAEKATVNVGGPRGGVRGGARGDANANGISGGSNGCDGGQDIEAPADASMQAEDENGSVRFVVADAITWAQEQDLSVPENRPDIVVVNPPRRGIGTQLCEVISATGARWLLYSSCNVESLGRDLQQLPGYRLQRVKVLDMFPHTKHFECLCLLVKDAEV